MKLIKTIIAGCLVAAFNTSNAQSSYGAIKGQIIDSDNEPVIGATVKVTSGGILIGGTTTDVEGKYTYKPLNPGSYEIIVSSVETHTKKMEGIVVNPDRTSYADLKVIKNQLPDIEVVAEYKAPVVDNSYVTMKSINADAYLHSAADRTDIKGMIVTIASDVSVDNNGDMHVRGSRGEATAYIIDGVRTENVTGVGALSVEDLTVITGGIPAQYGDMTSGVVIVTTKDYFSGIRAKHIRESAYMREQERIQREKQAKEAEEKRKKEIEEELKLEQLPKSN